ncbi:hypothetical protein JDV02_010513 [Purpureocillium takamizusanense]|uniref:Heterokaryon incompatibility domain-containing protein n=1 Tax=Purpureocillium takamizusanense TaxID=2060973 RepID=A0A9Q8QP23_9HYPO|nr:uncharacterized protein JDV02_010513 [Purpureocillium takamizusanense]UNI24789.1 hypothetical protein JDV02_010513 [Purpureocillium takamizusanense]
MAAPEQEEEQQRPSSAAPPPRCYAYSRLPDARSIRILTLAPSGDDASSPLTGTIEEALLDAVAPYETISYAWGDGSRDRALLVVDDDKDDDEGNEQEEEELLLPLTASLHDALARVRLPDAPRRIWADQICINQEDLAERSQQVRLMNAIYRGAARILVWLGRDEGVAEDAARMVRDLDAVFRDEERHRVFKRAHSEELHLRRREPWVPLSKMTRLPWFHRIWIVQEIGTDAPATLFWGASEIDWQVLSHVAGVLNQDYHHLRARFGVGTPNIRYLHRRFVEPTAPGPRSGSGPAAVEGVIGVDGLGAGAGGDDSPSSSSCSSSYDEHHNRGSFVYELHRARHMLARDPRDHVYAFLGHFSVRKGSWALAGLRADYARPVADVYVDVAVRVLKGATSLILLSACHNADGPQRRLPMNTTTRKLLFDHQTTTMDLRLPSWVPDWRVLPVHMIGSPETPHRAARDTLPRLLLVDEEEAQGERRRRLLRARGVRVDVIARRSWIFYGKAFQFKQSTSYSNPVDVLWREYCGYDTFNLEDRYPGGADAGAIVVGPTTEGDSSGGGDDDGKGFKASAFFALAQTLTNGCIGADRSRPYASIPQRRWLADAAAYLARSGIPPRRISPALRAAATPAAKPGGDAFKWSHEATLVTRYRRFGVTAGGRYVMGPEAMREGDAVVVLYGGRTPFVLRRVDDADEDEDEDDDGGGGGDGAWQLVGECYVHGIMNGEALQDPGLEEEVFSMR